MKSKIDELTEKIYKESIEKAEVEKNKIISNAKKKAEKIIKNANIKAEEIILHAKRHGDELRGSTKAEVSLSIRQAINAVRERIDNLIKVKVLEEPIREVFKDNSFLKKIIGTIITNWNTQSSEPVSIGILLSEKDEEGLKDYFSNKVLDILNSGLEVNFDDKINAGFKIYPKNGNYHISFTDDDFNCFFQFYLRPQLVSLLFGGK